MSFYDGQVRGTNGKEKAGLAQDILISQTSLGLERVKGQ